MDDDRFECWAGSGLPKGWAKNMGYTGDAVGDVVWPIVDSANCGSIDGYPRPEQMLCWCPSLEKQEAVAKWLELGAQVDSHCGISNPE